MGSPLQGKGTITEQSPSQAHLPQERKHSGEDLHDVLKSSLKTKQGGDRKDKALVLGHLYRCNKYIDSKKSVSLVRDCE